MSGFSEDILKLDELLDDGHLFESGQGSFDLRGWLAYSEKVGRDLTEEEIKQFEKTK